MKKSYEAPVLVTEPVVMGVFGCYTKVCEPVQEQKRVMNRFTKRSRTRGN